MQVAFVMSHSLLMSLCSFKLSINWNETTGLSDWSFFSDSIQNSFLSSQKKTVVIYPEMGESNAFPNDKAVCFEKWIHWDDKSAFYYLLTCLSSGELSLFLNPFTLEKLKW